MSMSEPAATGLTAKAESVAKLAFERAMAAERARQLSPEVIEAVVDAGFARHFVPARWGGDDGTFTDALSAVAAVGQGCTSAAWCASLTASLGRMASYLPDEGQGELWADGPDTVVVGGLMPTGLAERVPGGWTLSGRWSYVSLADASAWALLCGVAEGDELRFFAVPREQYRIEDTWRSVGMRATGSNSVSVTGLFVPESRSVSRAALDRGQAPHPDAVCRRVPLRAVNCLSFAAPIVGAGQGALRVWTEETARRAAPADNAWSADVLARTSGELDAAWLLLERAARSADALLVSSWHIARSTRDCAFGADAAVQAVTRLLRASGTGAQDESAPLQRMWRDVTAADTHLVLRWDAAATAFARQALLTSGG